ncbi:MAG: D-2-hydroxyacid dehydrogenase [Candidatus Binatia bacterium]|nr:D-2-hydroxyacid dehydrogenase [Candidatus Binatia bacterium]
MESIGLFANREFFEAYGQQVRSLCDAAGREVRFVLPPSEGQRFDEASLQAITVATFNGYWEVDPQFTRRFFGVVSRAPRLQWFHVPNAGVDHPAFAAILQRGVVITTSAGANAAPVAHSVMAAVLSFARGLPQWLAAQRSKRWQRLGEQRADLNGQTMVIVGLGAIGREVARLAKAFGLRVIAVRTQAIAVPGADEVIALADIDRVLPRADWLVLTCPLTEQTRGLIDAARLERLPPHAHLVNVSRGAVVDEPALIEALRAQRLAGAYLDVFAEEPLPETSPLWELPNVLLSPHDAAGARGNRQRVSELFLDNLRRWLAGEELRNRVRAGEVV